MSSEASTPLMRQYHAVKQQAPNTLLMFRLGDFYELFFEDAVTAARELEITLTSRNKEKGAAIPMCGVPYHAAEGYIARLVQKGYRVAICDQMEDPRFAKKLVRRELTRVVTPGTAMDANLVRSRENNYLAAVARAGSRSGVAHVDLSTGEFRVTETDPAEVTGALEQLGAREVLVSGRPAAAGGRGAGRARASTRTELEDVGLHRRLRRAHAARTFQAALARWLRPGQPARGRGRGRRHPALPARNAARRARSPRPARVLRPRRLHGAGRGHGPQSRIGRADLRRRCRRPQPSRPCSAVLDQTLTGMGGRLLRQRLLRPSVDRAEIEQRLDAVGELLQQTILRAELRKQLGGILDLERLLAKVTLGSAGPRDLLALGRSLEKIPASQTRFDTQQAARLRSIHERLDELADVAGLILEAIADEPPLAIADGGAIRAGFHAELDELRDLSLNGRQYIAQIEARERQRTGISRSRCGSTTSSATTSRSPAPTCTWRRPITSASRRWPMPNASPRRS